MSIDFLCFKKCSDSTISFFLMNSKEKTLWVRKAGNIYEGWVKPYNLMTIPLLKKKQSPILFSVEGYKAVFILGNTLGSIFQNTTLYIAAIRKFMNFV